MNEQERNEAAAVMASRQPIAMTIGERVTIYQADGTKLTGTLQSIHPVTVLLDAKVHEINCLVKVTL